MMVKWGHVVTCCVIGECPTVLMVVFEIGNHGKLLDVGQYGGEMVNALSFG